MHIVYVKLEIVFQEQELCTPCSNRQRHSLGTWLCYCSKACTRLGWSSKSSCAYDTTLHVQCMAKYMIDCKITMVARCIALWRSPSYVITWVTMRKKLCYLPENTWKERQARLLYKVTHCTGRFPANTRPWMDFHQWQHLVQKRMVSCSCLQSPARRPAHVSHDSGHAELVWVVCAHVLLHYC